MEKHYFEQVLLRTCTCDVNGEWRSSAILEAMQEAAGTHSAHLGIGWGELSVQRLAWVLSRSTVEMTRPPRMGEIVSVETYPTKPRHLFFPRTNVFRDAQGSEIGLANSLWVLINLDTRRIVSSAEVLAHIPDNSDLPMRLPFPATIRPLEGEAARGIIRPQFTDLDVNGHVNNTKYIDWCCNALGIETLEAYRLAKFDISYELEVRPGGEVETELVRRDDHFTFCGMLAGKRCFAVAGTLEARAPLEN